MSRSTYKIEYQMVDTDKPDKWAVLTGWQGMIWIYAKGAFDMLKSLKGVTPTQRIRIVREDDKYILESGVR